MQPDVGKAEAGGQAPYSYGRPNVRSILKNIQNNYSDASEIHVCAAGQHGIALKLQHIQYLPYFVLRRCCIAKGSIGA